MPDGAVEETRRFRGIDDAGTEGTRKNIKTAL
jgi:hypothetical protein